MNQFKVKIAGLGWRHVHLESLPRTCGCDEPLEVWLQYAVEEQHGERDAVIECFRQIGNAPAQLGVEKITVYQNYRSYGGPEEGGWYYDSRVPVREFIVPRDKYMRTRERLEAYCARQNEGLRSWEQDGRYNVVRGDLPVRHERPHYC